MGGRGCRFDRQVGLRHVPAKPNRSGVQVARLSDLFRQGYPDNIVVLELVGPTGFGTLA
jgi:hypothetical protein